MSGKVILDLFDVAWVGQKVDESVINDKWFFIALIQQNLFPFNQFVRGLNNFLVVVAQRRIYNLKQLQMTDVTFVSEFLLKRALNFEHPLYQTLKETFLEYQTVELLLFILEFYSFWLNFVDLDDEAGWLLENWVY